MNHEPDNLEKGVRFGCGFTFGIAVVTVGFLRGASFIVDSPWATGIAVAVVCGFLALKYGDDFWRILSDWYRR